MGKKSQEHPYIIALNGEVLRTKQDKYTREKTFDGLASIASLRFDFFLEDFNTAIEYNGTQHYRPVDWFGGIEGFKGTVARDEIKRKWCSKNKIRLIEIGYNESVGECLDGFFNGI